MTEIQIIVVLPRYTELVLVKLVMEYSWLWVVDHSYAMTMIMTMTIFDISQTTPLVWQKTHCAIDIYQQQIIMGPEKIYMPLPTSIFVL